tara:strand:+ start:136 stop:345 length:210 start_codon:yes stop_codon:yes gene_type:complete
VKAQLSFVGANHFSSAPNKFKSLQIQSDLVVVPSKELIDLIQAVRTFLTKIATENRTTSFLIQLSNSAL